MTGGWNISCREEVAVAEVVFALVFLSIAQRRTEYSCAVFLCHLLQDSHVRIAERGRTPRFDFRGVILHISVSLFSLNKHLKEDYHETPADSFGNVPPLGLPVGTQSAD